PDRYSSARCARPALRRTASRLQAECSRRTCVDDGRRGKRKEVLFVERQRRGGDVLLEVRHRGRAGTSAEKVSEKLHSRTRGRCHATSAEERAARRGPSRRRLG